MKQSAKILSGAYLLGVWIYGLWYVWEHWEGSTHIATLTGVGLMRAIVWPWRVVQHRYTAIPFPARWIPVCPARKHRQPGPRRLGLETSNLPDIRQSLLAFAEPVSIRRAC